MDTDSDSKPKHTPSGELTLLQAKCIGTIEELFHLLLFYQAKFVLNFGKSNHHPFPC